MLASRDQEDLTLLTQAAQGAGPIAMHFWRNSPQAWEKDAGAGPVTEADLAVNTHLETVLRTARPDYGWLSEESADAPERSHCDQVFIIDPIDGTRGFIAGERTFAVALAVATKGVVTAAAVYLPALDKLYAAAANGPALLNGAPISVGPAAAVDGAQILTNKSSLALDHWAGRPPTFDRHFRPSLAYRLCLVADGSFDGVLSFMPCWEWDIAAGSLIVQRAGGVATAATGEPLLFNSFPEPRSKGLWAAPANLHSALRDRMS